MGSFLSPLCHTCLSLPLYWRPEGQAGSSEHRALSYIVSVQCTAQLQDPAPHFEIQFVTSQDFPPKHNLLDTMANRPWVTPTSSEYHSSTITFLFCCSFSRRVTSVHGNPNLERSRARRTLPYPKAAPLGFCARLYR